MRRTIRSKNVFWKKSSQFFSEMDRTFFWLSAKILRKDCQKCFLRVQKHVEGTDFFNFIPFLSCCRFLNKTFLKFGRIFSTKLSKLFSTCSDENFDEKRRFLKIVFLVEIWANFFLTFGKKYSEKLAELLCKRSDEHFDVQPTSSLKSSSSLFGFWSKLFLNFRILFFAKCENCFLRIDTNTSIEKIFFENFSRFFGIGSKHFLIFGQKSTERLSELLSTCSKTCWRNRIFHFHSLLVVLSDFGQNFSDNWLKIFHKAVKTAFYVIRRTLWWKEMILETCFFSKFEQIYSWLLGKINLQSWQNCFLSVRTNTLMCNQQLLWKILLLLLAFVRIYLWVFEFFFFAKLWKLFPKMGDEHFDQKHFFLETSPQSFSESDRNIFWFSAKNPGKVCQNCYLRVQKHVEEKDFSIFFLFVV